MSNSERTSQPSSAPGPTGAALLRALVGFRRDAALMIIRLVLALIIQNYDISLAPGYRMKRDAQLTLGPKDGVSLLLREV